MDLKLWLMVHDVSYEEIAKQINRCRYSVYMYVNKKTKPSLKTCYQIVKFTQGEVTLEDLRPDLREKALEI